MLLKTTIPHCFFSVCLPVCLLDCMLDCLTACLFFLQPTLLYLTSGSPFWPSSDCQSASAPAPAPSDERTTMTYSIGVSSSSSSSVNGNSRDSGWQRTQAMLTEEEQSILATLSMRDTAQRNDLLRQFTFLIDSADKSLLANRFASLAPMAQVCSYDN